MNQKYPYMQSIKIILLGLLVAVGVSYVSAAWNPPGGAPPTNNTDAPINVGYSSQIKQGNLDIKGLISSGVAAVNGLIVENGNVGIGTTSPTQKLDVAGQIHATGDVCTDAGGVGGKCLSTAGGTPSGAQLNPSKPFYRVQKNVVGPSWPSFPADKTGSASCDSTGGKDYVTGGAFGGGGDLIYSYPDAGLSNWNCKFHLGSGETAYCYAICADLPPYRP